MRRISFSPQAWEDYPYWLRADKKLAKRLTALLRDIQRDPFDGIGKPEPLKGPLAGYWSRRLTGEHRVVYRAEGDTLLVEACRGHYD